MRGNPKDLLYRASQILSDGPGPCSMNFEDDWCAGEQVHVDPDDARWLLDLVEELLVASVSRSV